GRSDFRNGDRHCPANYSSSTIPHAMSDNRSAFLPLIAIVLAMAVVYGVRQLWSPPEVLVQDVRELVHTTIQREAGASFLVTGYLDVVATATVENRQVLLPGMLDLSLGTTRATVRVPGMVSYG